MAAGQLEGAVAGRLAKPAAVIVMVPIYVLI
jgi:hypothetical protein